MLTTLLITLDIIALLSSLFGNTFILVVKVEELVEKQKINLSGQLICGISFFSLSYEVLKFCGYILQLPVINLVFTIEVQSVSTVVCLALISSNIWISTWLSVHFCFRIVNIQHQLYMYLQRRFPQIMMWLLLPSVLCSLLLSLTYSCDVSETHWSNVILNSSLKNAFSSVVQGCACSYEAFLGLSILGFLLSLASLVTIITSIYRHIRQMRKSGNSFQSPNLEIHIKATKTITLLLVINAFFCYALALTAFKGNDFQWTHYIYIFTSVCYALNSLNIILGNRKLKRRFLAFFVPCSCYGIQNNA